MAYDSKVIIKILGDATNFDKAINGAEASLNSLKGVLAKLGLATSLGAVVKEVVSNTTQLETSLATASTLFGDVNVNMDNYTKKVMELSKQTGVASSAIVDASYQAMSSGVEVTENMDKMMDFMTQATNLSVAGMTSISNAVDSVAKIWNAYGQDVITVEQISKNLVMTQNLGITTVDELSQNLSKATSTASSFGVSLENVGASLSVMTKAGTPTAEAITYLSSVMSNLGKADTEASKNLKKAFKEVKGMDTSFQALIADNWNLQDILRVMKTYAEDAGLSLLDLFSDINAGRGALMIASDKTETFTEYMKQMGSEADIVQETVDKMMNTTAKDWSKLANRLKNITINIGMGTGSQKLMDSAYSLAEDVVEALEDWTPAINRAIMSATVGGNILFTYLKTNIDEIPEWIAKAFVGKKILDSVVSALGLSTTATGALAWSVALEVIDGLNGTKTWSQVGEELKTALAGGLTIGAFAGTNAGALTIPLMLAFDWDLTDLGSNLGKAFKKLVAGEDTDGLNPLDEKKAKSNIEAVGDYFGIVFEEWFSTVGEMFQAMIDGDFKGAITSLADHSMLLGAKTIDYIASFWKGKGYSEWTDRARLDIARRDTPSASQFGDGNLLRYLNEAEAQGIDLETYLQKIIEIQSLIDPIDLDQVDTSIKVENPITVIKDNSEDIQQVIEDVTEAGLTEGTKEWADAIEDIVKDQLGESVSNIMPSFSLNNLTWNNSIGIDPNKFRTKGTGAGKAYGEGMVEGTEEALDINSPSKVYQYIGEMAVAGLENGLDTETAYAIGEAVGEAVELGTRNALDIHSPAKTYEEIGELAIAGLEKGMTESALEELEKELEKTYTELGANIMKWLSEGTKDGQTYTFMDAVQDFFTGTKTYNALGKKIDKIEVKDTGIADLETGALGQGSSDDSGTEEKKSFWAKASDWLFGDIGDGEKEVGKTGFDVLNSLADSFTNLNSAISDSISASYESQISALEEARDNAKKYNELSVEEEKEYDKKIADLKKEQFEKQKKISLATAVIDGANAIMNIWKEWAGSPLMASALTAMSVATTAMQISTISSQSSGYERGGLIGGHGYTGDKQQIWANAGELILNRAQQRAIADQLSYGGNSTVVQVTFGGNVFGDRQTIAEYVYDAIKTAQSTGAVQAW